MIEELREEIEKAVERKKKAGLEMEQAWQNAANAERSAWDAEEDYNVACAELEELQEKLDIRASIMER
jgi:hypothetical protein